MINRLDEYPTLHTMLKQSPYEVRHLLIHSVDGVRATVLIQLISGNKTEIGSGTEAEMTREAQVLMQEWSKIGFRSPREHEQAWESLQATVTLASLMGYKVVYDPAYSNLRKNPTGTIPLAQWPGKQGNNGGSYHYAFAGTMIIAVPTLPPGHGINMAPSKEEFIRTIQQIKALQDTVGPSYELVLG